MRHHHVLVMIIPGGLRLGCSLLLCSSVAVLLMLERPHHASANPAVSAILFFGVKNKRFASGQAYTVAPQSSDSLRHAVVTTGYVGTSKATFCIHHKNISTPDRANNGLGSEQFALNVYCYVHAVV